MNNNSIFVQDFSTASTIWDVKHDLGKKVVTDVFLDNGDGTFEKVLPYSEIVVSDNEIKISFSNPESGKVVVR